LLTTLTLVGCANCVDVKSVLLHHLTYGNPRTVRITVIECFCKLAQFPKLKKKFIPMMLSISEKDKDTFFKYHTLKALKKYSSHSNALTKEDMQPLLKRLWKFMNKKTKYDIYLRRLAMDLYREWDCFLVLSMRTDAATL
jgi:hypothetical protein